MIATGRSADLLDDGDTTNDAPSSASTPSQALLPLPPNWVAYAATNNNYGGWEVGRVFYHNTITGKSQWTVPTQDPVAAAAAELSAGPDDADAATPQPAEDEETSCQID